MRSHSLHLRNLTAATYFLLIAANGIADPIVLDKLPLLFADDDVLATKEGVTRTVHTASTLAEPVVKADCEWEKGRVYLYGNVVQQSPEELQMWYSTPKPSSVLYATSRDGVAWTKPALDLFPLPDAPTNNVVYQGIHSPSVLFDEMEADPAKRYKMMGKGRGGYTTAYSADGMHWTAYPANKSIPKGDDTLVLSTDPRTKEYLCYHKELATIRGHERRLVYLSRSKDFMNWGPAELVFAPDEQDDAWAKAPDQRTEVYNMSVYPHAGGFLGFPTIFQVLVTRKQSELSKNQSPDDGPIDVQLATSRDGTKWSRTLHRENIIPRGAHGAFDKGAILGLATQPVHHGNKTWIYYTAVSTTHGAPLPPKEISIGRAEWRLHGFVSLDADASGGTVQTQPLLLKGPSLVVNADASQGALRIALKEADGRPIAGYDAADCLPITGDVTSHVVQWKSQQTVPTDRPVRAEIAMEPQSKLFSVSSVAP